MDKATEITAAKQNSLVSHPMQTWEWGDAREKMGIKVIKIEEDNTLYQMTIHPIPHTPFSIGYIPRSTIPSEKTLSKLYDVEKKYNLIFIKIEPYVAYDTHFKFKISDLKFVKSSHPLFPEWTQTLDLRPTESELLSKMKSKTRYNIRLAEKKGVTVSQMDTDEGFEIFSKLYFETCKRQNYHGHTPFYHRTIWNSLKSSQAHILIAFLDKTPLAAYELLMFKKRMYYLYGGSSLLNKNVMAPNLLMWEAIKLGKKEGAELFDMWGSLPPNYDASHSWAGFTHFKEGYGTTFTHLSASFDLIINPIAYPLYGFIYKMRSKII